MSCPTGFLCDHLRGLLEDEESLRDFVGEYYDRDDNLEVRQLAKDVFKRRWPDMPEGFLEALAEDVDEREMEEVVTEAVKDVGGFCHECWTERARLVESDGCQYKVDGAEHWLCEDCVPVPPLPGSPDPTPEDLANAPNECEICCKPDAEGERHAYCDEREAWFCGEHVGSNACHACESCADEDEDDHPEMDGDGLVICKNCGVGGGKCDGECC